VKRNPKMFRCRLVRFIDGAQQVITYVGPYDGIPKGWSMFARRVVGPSGGMAA
jgi:hypothetical protein